MTTQASGRSSGKECGDGGERLRDSTNSHKSLERHLLHSLVGQYDLDPAFASSVNEGVDRDSDSEVDNFGLDDLSYSEEDPGAGFRALLRSFEATVKESAFEASPIFVPSSVEPREESSLGPASGPAVSSDGSVFDFTRVAGAPHSSSSHEGEPTHTLTSDPIPAPDSSEADDPSVLSSTRRRRVDSKNPKFPRRDTGEIVSSETESSSPTPTRIPEILREPSTFCVKEKNSTVSASASATEKDQDQEDEELSGSELFRKREIEVSQSPVVDFGALLDSGMSHHFVRDFSSLDESGSESGGNDEVGEIEDLGNSQEVDEGQQQQQQRQLRERGESSCSSSSSGSRGGQHQLDGFEDGVDMFRMESEESESDSKSGSVSGAIHSHPPPPRFISDHIAIWTKVHDLMVRNGFVGVMDVLELCRRDVEKESTATTTTSTSDDTDTARFEADFDARLAESLTGAFLGILQEYERRGKYIEQLDSPANRSREMDVKTREVRDTEALQGEIRHLRGVNRSLFGKAKKALHRSSEGMERVKTQSRRTVSELRSKLKKAREEMSQFRSELEKATQSRDDMRQRYRQYKRAETESLARARQVFRNAVQRGPSTVEERRELSLIRYLLDQRSTLRTQLEALHSENEQLRRQSSERGVSSPRAGYVPPPADMRLPWMLSNSSTDSASMSSSSMFGSRSNSPTPSGGDGRPHSEVLHLRLSLKTLRSKFVDQRQSYERLLRQLKSQLELLEKKNRELRIESTVAKRRPLWQECVDDHGDSALRPILREVMTLTKTAQMNEIVPAVQKLCDVVRPVFQMKRFCRQVCQMLEQGQSILRFGQIVDPIPSKLSVQIRDVEDVLERWIKALQFVSSFRSLEKRCVKMLKTLPDCPVMSRSRHLSHARCERLILTGIQKLVKTTMMHREIEEAYDFVREDTDPSSLERRLIHRFMKLFDCPRPEGVFTQMNRLWVTHNANLSVLKNLKSVVGISESSSSEQLLQKIAELQRLSEIHTRQDSGEKE